jgi:phosphate starvation-inducible PhoH-like protein
MAKRKVEIKEDKPKLDTISMILPTRHRLKCKNQKQKVFANLITDKEIVLATGPAGVGKSYVAIARAIELLQNSTNQYNKILIINPAVEAEEKIGFLPGSLREKLDPFVGPSIDIIDKIVGSGKRVDLEEAGIIEVGGLGFIRGKTIDNTILVMEEAQNMSPNQMKTLLTRIGANAKFIISGDLDQSDRYNNYRDSGLYDAVNKHGGIEEIGLIEFDESEIVRNPLISKILANYKTPSQGNQVQSSKTGRLMEIASKVANNQQPNTKKKTKSKLLRKFKYWVKKNFAW